MSSIKHHQVKRVNGQTYYIPFCEAAKKKAKKYKHNQLVRFNPVGETDIRSPEQLRTYWAACNFTAERVDDPKWDNKDKVDVNCRFECELFNYDLAIYDNQNNLVYVPFLSIALENMEHLDACNYFNEAFQVMANKIPYNGIYYVDKFIADVMASCKRSVW